MAQNGDIDTMADQYKPQDYNDLSIGAIFNSMTSNDPLIQTSRSRQYSTLNFSVTVQDRHIFRSMTDN